MKITKQKYYIVLKKGYFYIFMYLYMYIHTHTYIHTYLLTIYTYKHRKYICIYVYFHTLKQENIFGNRSIEYWLNREKFYV